MSEPGDKGQLIATWLFNIKNSLILLFTGGASASHEGRYDGKIWKDWAKAFRVEPKAYVVPETIEEAAEIIKAADRIRVVGSGHSFNDGPLCPDTMISLDELRGVELLEHPDKPDWKVARVGAGIRLRDLTKWLRKAGYALSAAGSTDTQSIGGLIATDLHGTGRDHAFLSQLIQSLKIIDAHGHIQDCQKGDELFHAAIGGAGLCGVVVQADIEVEPAYNLATAVRVIERDYAEAHIDALLEENTHLSFYYFGGFQNQETKQGLASVRMNKWNRTIEPTSRFFVRTRRLIAELLDMGFSGFLFDLASFFGIAHRFANVALHFYTKMVNQSVMVQPAGEGFARKLYYRHDEVEYGVPRERYQECLRAVRALLLEERYPTIVEVRFSPDASQGLLGPGVGRPTAYIELASSMSKKTNPIFKAFEKICIAHDGQVHLGKKTWVSRAELEQMYGERLKRFEAVRKTQDPNGKFMNSFGARLFEPAS